MHELLHSVLRIVSQDSGQAGKGSANLLRTCTQRPGPGWGGELHPPPACWVG